MLVLVGMSSRVYSPCEPILRLDAMTYEYYCTGREIKCVAGNVKDEGILATRVCDSWYIAVKILKEMRKLRNESLVYRVGTNITL